MKLSFIFVLRVTCRGVHTAQEVTTARVLVKKYIRLNLHTYNHLKLSTSVREGLKVKFFFSNSTGKMTRFQGCVWLTHAHWHLLQVTNVLQHDYFFQIIPASTLSTLGDKLKEFFIFQTRSTNTNVDLISATTDDNIRYVNVGRLRRAEGLAVYYPLGLSVPNGWSVRY